MSVMPNGETRGWVRRSNGEYRRAVKRDGIVMYQTLGLNPRWQKAPEKLAITFRAENWK